MSVLRHAIDASNLGMAALLADHSPPSVSKDKAPEKLVGYLMKKKKWPRKGWHKRYFVLENGFLKYAKSPLGIAKNKIHGLMDIGWSVMSTKKKALTIDLDAEDTIFHLKDKSVTSYQTWVSRLRQHRDFRQLEIRKDITITNHNDSHHVQLTSTPLELEDKERASIFPTCSQELRQAQSSIHLLNSIVDELQSLTLGMTSRLIVPPSPTLSKKEKKQSKKAAKKLSKQPGVSTNNLEANQQFLVPENKQNSNNQTQSSHDLTLLAPSGGFVVPGISPLTPTKQRANDEDWKYHRGSKSIHGTPVHPQRTSTFSMGPASQFPQYNEAEITDKHINFVNLASKVSQALSDVTQSLAQKEESIFNQTNITNLRNTISQLSSENQDYKARLHRIQQESNLNEPVIQQNNFRKRLANTKPMLSQLSSESQLSITETASELFYDAEEYMISDEESSTDGEESGTGDEGASSDADLSEGSETTSSPSSYEVEDLGGAGGRGVLLGSTGRREKLPTPRPDTDVSLWNILKKNIGKDLSKVAMPVTLNEPLNALQLLCEELEYTELLEKASNCDNELERMIYVATFAISGYTSTYYRAGQKPFNPILGETFECIREDRRYRFVAEQVSHHPPISVCHCDGDNFEFWQDARFKNKFWGKSMEIFPIGSVHVRLKRYDEEYTWKKVTSCVHNIMSGTRWIEHYGDMVISKGDISCKIAFSKSGYWNNKNGEISGSVTDSNNEVVHKLHGKWFEGVFWGEGGSAKCIWRPGAMPTDHEKNYGFTRFAIELNELVPSEAEFLPATDTRFRPDQRCLEEGRISEAEEEKRRVEQLQRDKKKERDLKNISYKPRFFQKLGNNEEECWTFKGDYWKLRKEPGFKNMNLSKLW